MFFSAALWCKKLDPNKLIKAPGTPCPVQSATAINKKSFDIPEFGVVVTLRAQ